MINTGSVIKADEFGTDLLLKGRSISIKKEEEKTSLFIDLNSKVSNPKLKILTSLVNSRKCIAFQPRWCCLCIEDDDVYV